MQHFQIKSQRKFLLQQMCNDSLLSEQKLCNTFKRQKNDVLMRFNFCYFPFRTFSYISSVLCLCRISFILFLLFVTFGKFFFFFFWYIFTRTRTHLCSCRLLSCDLSRKSVASNPTEWMYLSKKYIRADSALPMDYVMEHVRKWLYTKYLIYVKQ